MIRNIDDAPYSMRRGTYGGASCDKDGVLIDGECWIVKYPKNARDLARHAEMTYTNDTVSEYIGSHVYQILGYPVHETMLVRRKDKIAVACKDFCSNKEILLEIRTIKNEHNEELEQKLETSFSSTGSAHCIELDEILLHLKYNDILNSIPGLTERFWDMVVVDALINNNDRNNGNWGIIRNMETGEESLAPIFDNGASFNGKTPDSRLEKMLQSPNALLQNAQNGISAYGTQGKNYNLNEIINYKNSDLKDALIRNVPIIKERLSQIVDMINDIPPEACSEIRKSFYIKTMNIRIEQILVPAYDKALESTKERLNQREASKNDDNKKSLRKMLKINMDKISNTDALANKAKAKDISDDQFSL